MNQVNLEILWGIPIFLALFGMSWLLYIISLDAND